MQTNHLLSRIAFLLLFTGLTVTAAAQPVVRFETGFSANEGYSLDLTLVGQNGWLGTAEWGNGLVNEHFVGLGQQAFIGFTAPEDSDPVLHLWRPLPPASGPLPPVLEFSVIMQIVDSSVEHYDDFAWSVFNRDGDRLFSLLFDNNTRLIYYQLDDDQLVNTELGFDNEGAYELVIEIDLPNNTWSAWLFDTLIVENQPVTTSGLSTDINDISAVWAFQDPANPGDNYMLFDDYRIVARQPFAPQPELEVLGWSEEKDSFDLKISGTPGADYAIQVTSDFATWEAFEPYKMPPGGFFIFEDTTAVEHPHSFYRVLQVN